MDILLLSAAVFTVCPYFTNSLLVSKWYFTAVVMLIGLPLLGCFRLYTKGAHCDSAYTVFENSVLTVCAVESLFLILQECGIAPKFGVLSSGTFDNVAGFASCVSLSWPLGLSHLKERRTIGKAMVIAVKSICLLAILMSASRAGLLCVALSTILMLNIPKAKRASLLLFFALTAACLAYFVKTESSKGRYFIAARSLEMVEQHPMAGWGMDGFRKNYMSVQAHYFAEHPDSEYAMLADGVRHPLNEYLRILVDFGAIGLLAFCVVAGLFITNYTKHRDQQAKTGMIVFAEILLMAMLSYPSYYPFTWLMLTYSLLCVFRASCVGNTLLALAIVACLVCAVPFVKNIKDELEWGHLTHHETYGLSQKAMRLYDELYKRMRGNAYFLYNYALELYYADKLNSALRIAKECREQLGADYDIELLLGNIHRQRKEYPTALYHYRQAHHMIPSRLVPLYGVYQVYDESGDTIRRGQMADSILRKAVKVESDEVKIIRKRIKSPL